MKSEHGPVLPVAGALPPDLCAQLLVAAQALVLDATDPERQPTSGSVRLRALGPAWFDRVLSALWDGPAGAALRQAHGPDLLCLVSQCWLRQQAPPALRPPGQHPHQWHQDGALGCCFDPQLKEDLAPLQTAWVPLVDCGSDAPSLEWVTAPSLPLLRPTDLADAAVLAQHGRYARQQARLAAGQALLFGPSLLHRTHVTPNMDRIRVSVELRFVEQGRLPARLHDQILRPARR